MKKDAFFLFKSVLVWRVALFAIAFLAIFLIPKFGARFPYSDRVLEITHLPSWIWGFGNFDGVHYLRIAQDGYAAQYSQAFFPLFPLLVRFFSAIFPRVPSLDTNIFTDPAYFYSGLILSNLFFLTAIFILYKLIRLDFKEDVVKWSIVLLLIFPTSFYFGSIYSESLFLLLTVITLYLARKEKFIAAGIFAALASATRIMGLFLLPVLLIELYKSWKLKSLAGLLTIVIAPLGILIYILYLKQNFGDFLYFYRSQPIFGAERAFGNIILLPQVFFRYAKIFVSVSPTTLAYWNAFFEFAFTLIPIGLLFISFRKVRFSDWTFVLLSTLSPTLTGTLSSMPRYSLMTFLLFPFIVSRYLKSRRGKALLFIVSTGAAIIFVSLFTRGYWVA